MPFLPSFDKRKYLESVSTLCESKLFLSNALSLFPNEMFHLEAGDSSIDYTNCIYVVSASNARACNEIDMESSESHPLLLKWKIRK